MAPQVFTALIEGFQWNGTNAAEIGAYVQAYSIANPNQFMGTYQGFNVISNVLIIQFTDSTTWDIQSNDWIVRDHLTLTPMLNSEKIRQYRSV